MFSPLWKKKIPTSTLNMSDLKQRITYGYKATDKDMMCRNQQYSMNAHFVVDGEPELCSNGFHFCKKIQDVNDYYNVTDLDSTNRVFEISTYGSNLKSDEKKTTTDNIKFLRELSREEIDKSFNIIRQFDHNGNLIYFSNSDTKIKNEYIYSDNDNSILEKKSIKFKKPSSGDRYGSHKNENDREWEIYNTRIEKYDGGGNIIFESDEYLSDIRGYHGGYYGDNLVKREMTWKEFTWPDNSTANYISECIEFYRYDQLKKSTTQIDTVNKQFITTTTVSTSKGLNETVAEILTTDIFKTDDTPYYQSSWRAPMLEGTKKECWSEYPESSLIHKMVKLNSCTYVYAKSDERHVDHAIVESFNGDITIENNKRSIVKFITGVDIEDFDLAKKIHDYVYNLIKSIVDDGVKIENQIDLNELRSYNLITEYPFGFVKLNDNGKKISEILYFLNQ